MEHPAPKWMEIPISNIAVVCGRYGENKISEPDDLIFDENAEKAVKEILGDREGKIYYC